jgi:hypothetical protein
VNAFWVEFASLTAKERRVIRCAGGRRPGRSPGRQLASENRPGVPDRARTQHSMGVSCVTQ